MKDVPIIRFIFKKNQRNLTEKKIKPEAFRTTVFSDWKKNDLVEAPI